MRRIITSLFLLSALCGTSAHAAIAYVKDTATAGAPCRATTGTASCSFSTLPSAGNAIIVPVFTAGNGCTVGASDNQGGASYSVAYTKSEANFPSVTAILYRENITAPSGTFTVTVTCTGASEINFVASEVSGIFTGTFDKSNTPGDVVANWCNGAATTTTSTGTLSASSEIIFTVAGGRSNAFPASWSAPTSSQGTFTLIASRVGAAGYNGPMGIAYSIVSATTAVQASWNCNTTGNAFTNYGTASLATFKIGTAPSGSLNLSVIRIGGS